MLGFDSSLSFSAFIASPHSSSEDLPPLDDDEELWEIFLELVLQHKTKVNKSLDDTLNTLLLFSALFSAVNVGIIALSLPTLTPADGTAHAPTSSRHANRVFAFCLTCSLIAAFFSLVGKQWLTHYRKLGPTAHQENRKTLQRRLDGEIRWHIEGPVEVGLTTLVQVTLVLFIVEWVPYLHSQGNTVSYPINGVAQFGAATLFWMFCCASWDPWCPFQTPYTSTIPQAISTSGSYCSKMLADFLLAGAAIRRTISEFISHPSLDIFVFRRPEETDEAMNIKSLCWMLENAPRGDPLLRVAKHVSSICFCKSQLGEQWKEITTSPHLRLHKTFWYLLMKIKRRSRGNPVNANETPEMLEHLSVFGRALIGTSHQPSDGPLLPSRIEELFKASFTKEYGPRSAVRWEDIRPFLHLQVSYTNEGRDATYHYNTI